MAAPASNLHFILKLVPGLGSIVQRVKVGTTLLGALMDLFAVYLVTVGLLLGTEAPRLGEGGKTALSYR